MNKSERRPTIIFIAGESRSGSTLLDMMLGSQEGLVSVGEMHHLQGYAQLDHSKCWYRSKKIPLVCTCGRPISQCDFWIRIERQSGLSFRQTRFGGGVSENIFWSRVVRVGYLFFGGKPLKLLARFAPGLRNELAVGENCFRVYDAIGAVTGAQCVVDSSKFTYQYILLKIARPQRVKLLTLYRDGRAVAHSMTRGERAQTWKKSAEPPFQQAAKNWVATNRKIGLFGARTAKCDRFTLRYEDFCANPQQLLKAILIQFGLTTDQIVLARERTQSHNIGGSPSRFDISNTPISLDESWREKLTPEQLGLFEKIGGRMNRQLGYE